jgi:hypothetical protein
MKFKESLILTLILIFTLILTGCAKQPKSIYIPTESNDVKTTGYEITMETDADNSLNEDMNTDGNGAKKDGFVFKYKGINIYLGEHIERILGELEPAMDYKEENSCSFEGLAKIYFYNGFEVATYLKGRTDKDRVFAITFNDDSISTTEGICIGQTLDDMVSIYGTEYEEILGYYTYCRYAKGGTILSFNIDDGIIVSILYQVEDIYA